MKCSYNWLKEWVDIPVDARTLAHELTMVGLQMASVEEHHEDTVLDLEITVNRPDCLSMMGLSREIAVIFGLPAPSFPKLHPAEIVHVENRDGSYVSSEIPLRIVLEDPDLCPRYCGQIIAGVRVGTSPSWIVHKLEACGLRSVNNVVDITNLVMLELGQPLHAFDYEKLAEGTIRVRRAREESLWMIDGQHRLLRDPMLVIADASRPQAVAGVMGGKDSEVSEQTAVLLLESAYFDPSSVRSTSKALELSTDASYRFERGADYNLQAVACKRAAILFEEIAGGKAYPVLDVCAHPFELPEIEVRPARVERILGQKVEPQFIDNTLIALGFHKKFQNRWEVPSFRVDVSREIDLIEEIARHYGYNQFPDTLPKTEKKYQADYPTYELERIISSLLRAAGIDEAYTYSFGSPMASETKPSLAPAGDHVVIVNPISDTANLLRTSLLPGLLESIEHNLRHRNQDVRLFEIGRVFLPEGEKIALGIVWLGDYRELKGVVEAAFPALNYPGPSFRKGKILVSEECIGQLGQAAIDSHPVQTCEIYLSDLIQLPRQSITYEPIIPFPFVERDISFIVDDTVTYSALESIFHKLEMKELRSCKLIDRYQGVNIPGGRISYTFQLIFQSETRTLTSEEVDSLYEQIVKEFQTTFGAELRK